MKTCTKCKKRKDESEYYKNKATLSGLDNFCKECRVTRTNSERSRYADSYRFVEEAKKIIAKDDLKCACCGNKNFKWLQIDHIKPVKGKRTGQRTAMLSRKIALGMLPSDEFQLLCANCNFAKADLESCPIDHSLD
jgi:hypothetical protein